MPGQPDFTVIHAGSPLAHTLAIADAARVYVETQRCFSDDEFKPADVRRAVDAHKALYAAVDAEKAALCTSPSCGDRPHSAHPSWSEAKQAAGGLDDEGTTTGIDPRGIR